MDQLDHEETHVWISLLFLRCQKQDGRRRDEPDASADGRMLQDLRGGQTNPEDVCLFCSPELASFFLYGSNRTFCLFYAYCIKDVLIMYSWWLCFTPVLSADPVLDPPTHHFNIVSESHICLNELKSSIQMLLRKQPLLVTWLKNDNKGCFYKCSAINILNFTEISTELEAPPPNEGDSA